MMKTSILIIAAVIAAVASRPTHKLALLLQEGRSVGDNVCLDEKTYCKSDETCCELAGSGKYGCCPEKNGVCCGNGERCCPDGYTCGLGDGKCTKTTTIPENTVCPDSKSECPSGQTCCQLSSGKYGCCPVEDAVCCSDGIHCCSHGDSCIDGKCLREGSVIPMLTKQPAIAISLQPTVKCPDDSECASDQTCCQLSSGKYGCCPQKDAVCCSDGIHCCPHDYTCDTAAGKCEKEGSVIPMLTKQPAMKSVLCPDGRSECASEQTCCKLESGHYGCCPDKDAVCCSDKVHCCPHGDKCDLKDGTCTNEGSIIPMLTNQPAMTRNLKSGILCPDGTHECPSDGTCCQLTTGKWGCCSFADAVCCGDGVHCCPEGTTCDLSSKKCVGSRFLEMMDIIAEPVITTAVGVVDSWVRCGKTDQGCNYKCCSISTDHYMCCPYQNGVCCAGTRFCCDFGQKCQIKSSSTVNCKDANEDVQPATWLDYANRNGQL